MNAPALSSMDDYTFVAPISERIYYAGRRHRFSLDNLDGGESCGKNMREEELSLDCIGQSLSLYEVQYNNSFKALMTSDCRHFNDSCQNPVRRSSMFNQSHIWWEL